MSLGIRGLSAFVLLAASSAGAGTIKGKIQFAGAKEGDDISEAVVFVSTRGLKDPPPASPAKMAQKSRQFVPRVVPVVVGQSVEFENQDAIYHNVFALGPVSKFDLGKYEQGRGKTVLFDKVGVQEIFCDIHRTMIAAVVVLPNKSFAQPGKDGTFEIKGVPAGKHEVRVWHRKGKTAPALVTVGDGAAEANFSLERIESADEAQVDKFGQARKKGY